mgnify:CR=1 FL=1
MTEISQKAVKKYTFAQFVHIYKFGCSGIKCKRCCLNKVCCHFPSKAKDVAFQMIMYAKTVEE